MAKQIAVLVGSAGKTSYNLAVVRYLQSIAPEGISLNISPIADLPLYERDLDEQDVPAYNRLRETVQAADAVLWVSPEHNGQVSAMLKNAVDVVSRPSGKSLWIGKKVGLVTVNARGSDNVIKQLRELAGAAYINMQVAPVTAAVGGIFSGAFNEAGELVSEQAKADLQQFITEFARFVA